MYERTGMGYSEAPWYVRTMWPLACAQNAMLTCVTDDPADVEWRNLPAYVGGPRRCSSVTGGVLSSSCKTAGNRSGRLYCCLRTTLEPSAYEAMEQRIEESLQPGQRVCDVNRYSRDLLRNEAQRATWDIQDKLCQLGVDPGPVNGNASERTLAAAVRSYQRQMGLPTTGQVDAATASMMGFSASDSVRIAEAVLRTQIGTEPGTIAPPSLSTPVLVASFGAAAFLAFAAYTYFKR
jgi:hypothetical protein